MDGITLLAVVVPPTAHLVGVDASSSWRVPVLDAVSGTWFLDAEGRVATAIIDIKRDGGDSSSSNNTDTHTCVSVCSISYSTPQQHGGEEEVKASNLGEGFFRPYNEHIQHGCSSNGGDPDRVVGSSSDAVDSSVPTVADDASARHHRLFPHGTMSFTVPSSSSSFSKVVMAHATTHQSCNTPSPTINKKALVKAIATLQNKASTTTIASQQPPMYFPGMEPIVDDEAALLDVESSDTAIEAQAMAALLRLPCCGAEYLSPLFWTKVDNAGAPHNKSKAYDTILPLGGDCASASAVRFAGLRQLSHPFDWVRTTPSGILRALDATLDPAASNEVLPFDGINAAASSPLPHLQLVEHLALDSNDYASVKTEADASKERFLVDTRYGFLGTREEAMNVPRRMQRLVDLLHGKVDVAQPCPGHRFLLIHVARTTPHSTVTAEEVSIDGRLISHGGRDRLTVRNNDALPPTTEWAAQRWEELLAIRSKVQEVLQRRRDSCTNDVAVAEVHLVVFNLWPFPVNEDDGAIRNVVVGFGDDGAAWESTGKVVGRWLETHVSESPH